MSLKKADCFPLLLLDFKYICSPIINDSIDITFNWYSYFANGLLKTYHIN